MTTPNPTRDWIDAARTKPDDGITVLLYAPMADEPVWPGWYDSAFGRWRLLGCGHAQHTVTHWRDFPEPPKK